MSPMQPNCQNCSKADARAKELEQALWECLRAMTDSASLLRDAYPVVAAALDDLIKQDALALGVDAPQMPSLDLDGTDDMLN